MFHFIFHRKQATLDGHWPSFSNFRVILLYSIHLVEVQWIIRKGPNLHYKCDIVWSWKLSKIILCPNIGDGWTWVKETKNSKPFCMNGQHSKFDPNLKKNKENEKRLKNSNAFALSHHMCTSLWENIKLSIQQVWNKTFTNLPI